MPECWLQCDVCQARYELAARFFGCPACRNNNKRAPLEVRYSASSLNPMPNEAGIWRWKMLLPPVAPQNRISLGEGSTSLLPISSGEQQQQIYLKNETGNPTWSWKDRPNSVSVSLAQQFGFRRAVAKSTGNHGNSVAAYATAGGLSSVIFCHDEAPALQLALMEGYGARVVRGGNQDDLLVEMIAGHQYFPCTILCPRAGYTNPFGIEGFKTIAFEICEELNWSAPDCVFVPVGSGDGIYGVWKGFRELAERGQISKVPRMIGCQASGADSAYRAWQRHSRTTELLASVTTAALSVGESITGNHALRAIYESGGAMMVSSEEEIQNASCRLRRKGLALEPASALAFACAEQCTKRETPETWVVIGSGAAVKWPDTLLRDYNLPPIFTGSLEEITK